MAAAKTDQKVILARVYARLSLLVALVLIALGSVLWGVGSYAKDEVKTELSAQKIFFPAKGSAALDPTEFPDLQQYAGQQVDDGMKARAYANGFIGRHLQKVADGKTYAEVSALAMKDPKNTTLQAQKQTLLQGETLRGILLGNGYGYWMMGTLATVAAIVSGAAAVLLICVFLGMRSRALRSQR